MSARVVRHHYWRRSTCHAPLPKQWTMTTLELSPPAPEQPSIADVVKIMSSIDNKIDIMNTKIQEQLNSIHRDMIKVVKENMALKEKILKLEHKLDYIQGRSRHKNLSFYNMPAPQGQTETWADCEGSIQSLLKDKLKSKDNIKIEKAHRPKSGAPPPFSTFPS